jgi:hypothetical protein
MHKWMAKAAGGTNQRLKPGEAMVRSFDKKPGASLPKAWAPAEMAVDMMSPVVVMALSHYPASVAGPAISVQFIREMN